MLPAIHRAMARALMLIALANAGWLGRAGASPRSPQGSGASPSGAKPAGSGAGRAAWLDLSHPVHLSAGKPNGTPRRLGRVIDEFSTPAPPSRNRSGSGTDGKLPQAR